MKAAASAARYGFALQGPPSKLLFVIAQCANARLGSAFTVELIFLAKAVAFEGAPSTYTYRSPDHGRLLHYAFCPTCGTRLGVTLERFPGVQIIYAGTYDNSSWSYARLPHLHPKRCDMGWSSRRCGSLQRPYDG